MEKLSKEKRTVCAAILGISNLGLGRPDIAAVAREIRDLHRWHDLSPRHKVCMVVTGLGNHFMENDEQQTMFVNEAMSFYRDKSLAKNLAGCWKDVAKLYDDAAVKVAADAARGRAMVRSEAEFGQ